MSRYRQVRERTRAKRVLFLMLFVSGIASFAASPSAFAASPSAFAASPSAFADGCRGLPVIRVAEPKAFYERTFDLVRPQAPQLQAHFARVIEFLKARDVSHLTTVQRAARAINIERLAAYAEAGVFPHNDTGYALRAVFLDAAGRRCAVCHLMAESGAAAIVADIAARENLAYVPQFTTPGVEAWIDASGLTLDECAMIQPTYLDAIIVDLVAESRGPDVALNWAYDDQYDDGLLFVSIRRDEIVLAEFQLFDPGWVGPPTDYVDVTAPYGSHEYRVYATDLYYWDEDLVAIDHQPTRFIRGDANDNGVVEGLADTIWILTYAFSGGPKPPCMAAADSDGNGMLQPLSDALYIMYYAYASGPPPTSPFPDCGPDDEGAREFGCASYGASCP